jgi:hypothetical protein
MPGKGTILKSLRYLKMSLTILAVDMICAVAATCLHAQSAPVDEAPFVSENAVAMNKMMSDMTVKPTGNVDADFAAMMIPHHQGAIDMALAELRHGKNEQLRRIAQEIVSEQQQEIVAMRLALGQPLPPSVPAQTQAAPDQSTYDHSFMPMSSSANK